MENNNPDNCCPSQLRYDIASKDWVVIATGRGKRPDAFKNTRVSPAVNTKDCFFCNLQNQASPILAFSNGRPASISPLAPDWTLAVIPNKYPAFFCPKNTRKICQTEEGQLYRSMDAVGFCEVVITRSHENSLALMSPDQVNEVIDAYQARYLELKKEKFVNYISIFHNHGPEAGASQSHPHSQIITSPLIDVDLVNALDNAKKYYRKHKKCLACEMTAWEKKVGKRVIFENRNFIASCPFASKAAFEVIISPKKHSSNFELITEENKRSLAQAFSVVLNKLYKGLNNPAYNFYLHTAPCDGKDYRYYHWHWTILPKTATLAGFEMGARMEISTIAPESAAEYLRQQ